MSAKEQEKTLRFGYLRYVEPRHEAVMALTAVGQLLPIPYKDSAAGSNPREFQGMKSATNKKILESLLKNSEIFWALHSGVTVTVTSGGEAKELLEYEDACLTNGLQTITIVRILAMIKAYQVENGRAEIHTKINRGMTDRWLQCMHNTFSSDVAELLSDIKIEHVNSVLNWLNAEEHTDLRNKFNGMSLSELLNIRVSIKVVLLDSLVRQTSDVNEELRALTLENLGYEIAEANNETQKVEAGDLFGTHHEKWLKEELFKKATESLLIKIEYRRLAEDRSNSNQRIIHVLELLRAILPTSIIIDSDSEDAASFVAGYANRRDPIYNWFEKKVINPHEGNNPEIKTAVRILRNLMPDMVEMMFLVNELWEKERKSISFKAVNQWTPLKNTPTTFKAQLFEDEKWMQPRPDADSILKKYLGFSFANVFTMFVFATRKAIQIDDDLNAKYEFDNSIVEAMVKEIYKSLSKERLKSFALGSTSEIFRNADLYRSAEDTFSLISTLKNIELSNYIEQYRARV